MTDTETMPVIDWRGLNKNLSNTDGTIALIGQLGMFPAFGFIMLGTAKVSIPVWVGVMIGVGVAVVLYALFRLFTRYDVIMASLKEGQTYELHDGRRAKFLGWDERYLRFALADGTTAEFHVHQVAKALEHGRYFDIGTKDSDVLSISDVLRTVLVRTDRHVGSFGLSFLSGVAGVVCMALNSQQPNVALLATGCLLFVVAAGFFWNLVGGVWKTYRDAKFALVSREWNVSGSTLQFTGLSLFRVQARMKDKAGKLVKLRLLDDQAVIC